MYEKSSFFIELLDWAILDLSPRTVSKLLLKVIASLSLLFLLEKCVIYWLNTEYQIPDPSRYFNYFNFDRESNFPSLYSALTLGFCSFLLAIVTAIKREIKAKYIRHWQALTYIFFFLAIDETCGIHEIFIPIVRRLVKVEGIFYFAWVIPAFFVVAVFLIAFRKFVFSLPAPTKFLFIASGTVYIFGALGLELVGGYLADNYGFNTVGYTVASTIEELLEMFGIVIFTHALLSYIQAFLSELKIAFSFKKLHD